MSDEYVIKLIQISDDLFRLWKEYREGTPPSRQDDRLLNLDSKINYLVGYITALKEPIK